MNKCTKKNCPMNAETLNPDCNLKGCPYRTEIRRNRMPNSLKTKLSKLRYQGKITDEEYRELIDKLEGHDEAITAQIMWERDIAIEQLKLLGYGLGEKVEPCEDCISREAVRRILANQRDELVKLHTVNPKDNPKADAMAYGVNWSLNTLMELPSVTPSYNSIKIELEPCKDCISRQAVLDKKELVELEDGQSFYCINPEDVETLPSVKPQRPSGEAEIWERIKAYIMSDGFMDDYPEDVIAEIWMMRKELENLKND